MGTVAWRRCQGSVMATAITLAALASTLLALVIAQNSLSASCLAGEECVRIRTCATVVGQLQAAKATQDTGKRNRIIQDVRDKVCGKRKDRKVCCAKEEEEPLVPSTPKKIGTFSNIYHDIGGTAYAVNATTVLVRDFHYDGEGPAAFFLAGTAGRPSKAGKVVLPYPFQGDHFQYRDKNIPILGRFTGDKDLVLHLPPGTTVNQLKWISVWC